MQISAQPVHFIVACCKKKHVFALTDVIRLEASSNYTVIHSLHQRPLTVAKVLCDFEPLLLQTGFIRTHRSHLINRQYIQSIQSSGELLLSDNSKIKVSRRKQRDVLAKLFPKPKAVSSAGRINGSACG